MLSYYTHTYPMYPVTIPRKIGVVGRRRRRRRRRTPRRSLRNAVDDVHAERESHDRCHAHRAIAPRARGAEERRRARYDRCECDAMRTRTRCERDAMRDDSRAYATRDARIRDAHARGVRGVISRIDSRRGFARVGVARREAGRAWAWGVGLVTLKPFSVD